MIHCGEVTKNMLSVSPTELLVGTQLCKLGDTSAVRVVRSYPDYKMYNRPVTPWMDDCFVGGYFV